MKKTDKIFAEKFSEIVDFNFNEKVASVFPDMIQRSVPGYAAAVAASGILAQHYALENSNIYDLGASLGAASFSIASKITEKCRIIAVDNSKAMIKKLSANFAEFSNPNAELVIKCCDIMDLEIKNASFAVLNYTLQFLPPDRRLILLKRICDAMIPGGALLISEKIKFKSEKKNELYNKLHYDFKRANGYSELEIAQKRAAIENVLIPETLQKHFERFKKAGFDEMHLLLQNINFVSILVLKNK